MNENDKKPVWEDLDYEHDAIVEASAGTGKTYALEHMVAHLVSKKGVDVRKLLLVTFTEKAAGELKERIRKMLAGTTAAKQLDEATICTIHSFCQDLLHEYPFESGMQMVSDVVNSDRVLIDRAVQSVITSSKFQQEYGGGERFTNEMQQWDNTRDSQGLKRTARDRVAAIVQSGLDPKLWREKHVIDLFARCRLQIGQTVAKIMQQNGGKNPGAYICDKISFTPRQRRNAQAFRELDAQLDGLNRVQLEWNDVVSRGLPILEGIGGLGVTFGLYDADGRQILGDDGGRGVRFNERYPLYSELKNIAGKASKVEKITILDSLGEMAYAEFLRLKKRSRTMTFDDMILATSRAVKDAVEDAENPVKQAFLKNIRSRYRIALVDEFQDTDDKQWTIFSSLFSSKVNMVEDATPRQGCLIVVGDPKQAIYSFRGADIGTYLTAKSSIKKDGGRKLSLETMYRSSREMVESFNKIFGKPEEQTGTVGWFDNMHSNGESINYEEVSFPENPPEYVRDFKYPDGESAVELLESIPQGATAQKKICLPLYLENMAEEMIRLHKEEFWKGKMPWSSMCVLVKSHSDGNAAQAVLRAKGIPCRIYKEAGLFDSAESESILALFDYLSMPRRAGNLAALLLTPFFEVPLSGIEKRLMAGDVEFDRLCDHWRTYVFKCEWVKLFESAVNDTALGRPHFAVTEDKSRIDGDFLRHRSAIRQIFDLLLAKCGRARDLTVFSDALRTWRRDDDNLADGGSVREKESEDDTVQIMTMHASKGLEFNAVFVAYGFSSVNMSGTPSEDRPAEEMELRRLLYVALTRAKLKLYLPWSKRAEGLESWESGNTRNPTPLSTFLGRGIVRLCGNIETAKKKVRGLDAVPGNVGEKKEGDQAPSFNDAMCPDLPPRLGMKGWRFKWDSFSSLCHHAAPKPEEVEGVKAKDDELSGSAGGDEGQSDGIDAMAANGSLVPKGALSGTVFHEVMEKLCQNDKVKGEIDFSIGQNDDFESLVDESENSKSPLLEIVRRRLAANGVVNKIGAKDGESTAVSIARMAWNALRTEVDIGGDKFRLCDVELADRKAEVNFVFDENLFKGGSESEGALNGSIDLVVRRSNGKYVIVDWKTNALENYSPESVKSAMDAAGYHNQYQIYTLAAEKWLGDESVAGAAYLFVRGGEFGESSSGVFACSVEAEDRGRFLESLVGLIGTSDRKDEEREEEGL